MTPLHQTSRACEKKKKKPVLTLPRRTRRCQVLRTAAGSYSTVYKSSFVEFRQKFRRFRRTSRNSSFDKKFATSLLPGARGTGARCSEKSVAWAAVVCRHARRAAAGPTTGLGPHRAKARKQRGDRLGRSKVRQTTTRMRSFHARGAKEGGFIVCTTHTA